MENKLYQQSEYYSFKHKKNLYLVLDILLFLIILTIFGLSAFLVKKMNITLLIVIDAIILFIGLSIFAYILIETIVPMHKRLKFLKRVMLSSGYQGVINIKEISSEKILEKGIKGYEISAVNDVGNTVLYFIESNRHVDLPINKDIKVTVAKNFIVEIIYD